MNWRRVDTGRAFDLTAADLALLQHIHQLVSNALAEGWPIERLRSQFRRLGS